MLRKIIKQLIMRRYYEKHSKTNIFNQYPEKNNFGVNSSLLCSKWGRCSGCNVNCNIAYTSIGNYCQIASFVTIGPRNHVFTNFTINDFPYLENEHSYSLGDGMFEGYFNKIGHDVWIGASVIIIQGVEIGNGAIVAMGSAVTKSVPPYAIVGGNPAKIIRYRFSKDVIEKLEELKWYEWDLQKIMKHRKELEEIVGFDIDNFKQKYWRTPKKWLTYEK